MTTQADEWLLTWARSFGSKKVNIEWSANLLKADPAELATAVGATRTVRLTLRKVGRRFHVKFTPVEEGDECSPSTGQ